MNKEEIKEDITEIIAKNSKYTDDNYIHIDLEKDLPKILNKIFELLRKRIGKLNIKIAKLQGELRLERLRLERKQDENK